MAQRIAINPELWQGPVMERASLYVKNGQSWHAGQLLYADTSGRLCACASNAARIKYLALSVQTDPGADDTTKATVGVITHCVMNYCSAAMHSPGTPITCVIAIPIGWKVSMETG